MALTRVGGAVKSDRIFDTVAAMVASKTVKVGDIVETAGYTAANDGGGTKYEIVAAATGTDDGGSFIDLDTHQAKLIVSGAVNVKWFGARGAGSTDDSTAIQNAITFVARGWGSGQVFLPLATYATASTINIPNFVEIIGESKYGTRVLSSASVVFKSDNTDRWEIRSMTIEQSGSSPYTSIGIQATNTSTRYAVRDCYFQNLSRGIVLQNGWVIYLSNLSFENGVDICIDLENRINGCHIVECNMEGGAIATTCVRIGNVSNAVQSKMLTIQDCTMESYVGSCIQCADIDNIVISRNWFEANNRHVEMTGFCERVVISENILDNATTVAIDVNHNGSPAKNTLLEITGNNFSSNNTKDIEVNANQAHVLMGGNMNATGGITFDSAVKITKIAEPSDYTSFNIPKTVTAGANENKVHKVSSGALSTTNSSYTDLYTLSLVNGTRYLMPRRVELQARKTGGTFADVRLVAVFEDGSFGFGFGAISTVSATDETFYITDSMVRNETAGTIVYSNHLSKLFDGDKGLQTIKVQGRSDGTLDITDIVFHSMYN